MGDANEVSLYIVRHGECLANLRQSFLPPFEDFLTPVGEAQAELLGDFFKSLRFHQVFCSDYPRTRVTCEKILSKNNNKDVINQIVFDQRIRERNCAGLVGHPAKEGITLLKEALEKGQPYLEVELPPESETVREFEERIISFFSELIKSLPKEVGASDGGPLNVLIVSHGMTIQRLITLLNDKPEKIGVTSWKRNKFGEKLMRNTSFHKVNLKFGGQGEDTIEGQFELVHCRDHLDQGPDPDKHQQVDKARVNDASGNYSFIDGNKNDDDKDNDKPDRPRPQEEIQHYCSPA